MNQALAQLLESLRNPDAPLSVEAFQTLRRDFPFFSLPALQILKQGGAALPDDVREEAQQCIALSAPDPAALFMLLGPKGEEWAQFYPPEQSTASVDTVDAISKFLETYGHADPKEEALLERLIFNPVPPDYAALLEKESDGEELIAAPADGQDALIDAFLAEQKEQPRTIESVPATPEEEPRAVPLAEPVAVERPVPSIKAPEDSSLSESLAKIYIRQKRYDKAFEIIHTLSLNNPKKSAYFADQLRFLRKLMLLKNS